MSVRLSVVIICYRRREYLPFAVASCLRQTLERSAYEVVVVKDWADDSFDRELASEDVRLIQRDLPIVGEMMATGLSNCSGDVVSFLDDDDACAPDRLRRVVERFESEPSLVLLRNGFEPIDRKGQPAPEFERILPQPRAPFAIEPVHAAPGDFARVVRTRAYGNLSTMSVRRPEILRRIEDLPHVEACTDASVATLMMDAEGRHRFDPAPWTQRRVSTSFRSLGTGAEGRRAVATFSYLRERARCPFARRYAEMSLAGAKVDAFLNSIDGELPFEDWLRFVYYHRDRSDPHTLETEAWSLAKWLAPGLVSPAYFRRRARWEARSSPKSS